MLEQNINNLNKSTAVIIGIVIVLVLVGVFFDLQVDDEEPSVIIQQAKQELVIPDIESSNVAEIVHKNLDFPSQLPHYDGVLQFVKATPLVKLANSDAEFSLDILSLSEQLQPSLFKQQVIRKSIFSINDMAQGMRPPIKRLAELSFNQPFTVYKIADKLYISQASYQRYDQLAQAIDAINVQMAVTMYQKYRPLFQQVFAELSYPESYQLLDIIKAMTGRIIAAPVINRQIEVIRPSVYYKFANPKLEKLTSLEKGMLRMGPENTRLIQNKLRELIASLIVSEQE